MAKKRKFIIKEEQLQKLIDLEQYEIFEMKKSRSLFFARKAGISSIYPKSAIKANPLRFRPYMRNKIEEHNYQNP